MPKDNESEAFEIGGKPKKSSKKRKRKLPISKARAQAKREEKRRTEAQAAVTQDRKSKGRRSSCFMADGITKRFEHYGKLYVEQGRDIESLSLELNPDQPDAPRIDTLHAWRRKHNWDAKRTLYNQQDNAINSPAPEFISDLEGQIEQIRRAYNPDGARETALKHYSDNLSEKTRPFYIDSLSDPDLLSLERDIAVVNTFLAEAIDQIDKGGSVENWERAHGHFQELMASFSAVQDGDTSAMHRVNAAMKNLSRAFNFPNRGAAKKQVGIWQDQKRRLISTEIARIEKAETYININDAMRLSGAKLGKVMQVIRNENNPALSLKVCEALGLDV